MGWHTAGSEANRQILIRRFQQGEIPIKDCSPLSECPGWAKARQYVGMPGVQFHQAFIGEIGVRARLMGRGMKIVFAAIVNSTHSGSLLYAVEEGDDAVVVFDTLEKHCAPDGWE